MDAIEINDVHKSFGKVTVLQGIDLQVPAGTVFALLGPNGAGKTTLINIATTLLLADRGVVRVAGHDVARDPEAVRRAISVTGQRTAVDEVLTATENLIMMARLSGLSRPDARRRATLMIDQFELGEAANRRVRTFSGGMRRRLDLALSLVTIPAVIFLDEPTTGLDTRSRQALWRIIRDLAASGVTVLLTTQYLEEADQLASRVAVMNNGTIVAVGNPRELKVRVGQEVLEVRDPSEALLAEVPVDGSVESVRRALADLDDSITRDGSVVLRKPTLDDVFLTLTSGGVR
jgi:ABC-2 type transport system ATP-binding protein